MTERILRALLRLAPPRFTTRYGDEALATHRSRAKEERRVGARLWFAFREVTGMAFLVLRLWLGRGPDGRAAARQGHRAAPTPERLWSELRVAARTLRRAPGFTLTVVAILALGIGANTAIFSAANAFFFRPLPFRDPGRLVRLYETNPEFGWTDADAAPANVLDWREQVDAFQDVATYSSFVSQATYIRNGEPELLGLSQVSGNFFDVLGVKAEMGRTFRWEETWDGDHAVAMISHALWITHFGGDPGIVGRTLDFPAGGVEVVGVLPDGFTFPSAATQVWIPWGWNRADRDAVWFRRAHWVVPVARLKPGVSMSEADAQLQVVVQRLQERYPETNSVMGAGFMPFRRFLIRDVQTPLLVLLGAVGLLLLLACTNVANLMMVRAGERSRETAVRVALGAGRLRILRQVLTESLLLAMAGGALGLWMGWTGVKLIRGLLPLGIPGATGLALDHRVVAFALGAALVSGLFFGLASAARSFTRDPQRALTEGGRSGSASRRQLRGSNVLVAAEVALALLLVVGAGLMIRSVLLLRDVNPGFQTEGTLAVRFTIPTSRYASRNQVLTFYDQFLERLEAVPGVERAGTVGQLPLNGASWSSQFQARGWPPDRVGFEILHRRADRGYFEALGIPLLRGRLFDSDDGPDAPLVVVINERLAQEFFPGEDPIGQEIAYDRAASDSSTWYRIVGIVGDQAQETPGEPPRPEVFENRNQDWGRDNWVVIRTSLEPLSLLPAVRAALKEMDPLIPIAATRPLMEVWRTSMAKEELILVLLSVFGIVALALAGVGVYGVTAQAAKGRTQEIGIRMALGAEKTDVVGLMLWRGLGVIGLGLAVGLVAALLATRAMASFLFHVEPTDPGTLLAVIVLLGAVATAACYLPARRATTVDPVRSLRAE